MRQPQIAACLRARIPRAFPRASAAALALVVLGSCAAPPAGTQRQASDQATAEALYTGIDIAVARYREGLQALRGGEREGGLALMDDAIADLAAGGNSCVETEGCEPGRFLSAYASLLAMRNEDAAGGWSEDAAALVPTERDSPILADMPELDRSMSLLKGQHLDEVIKINGPVKAALADWLTWMRPLLVDAYENYQYMRHLMWPAYEKAGLPEALLFGILAKESGGRVHAVSHAGAAGPFQFMYTTGLRFGLRSEDGFDLRYDPAAAARANVDYLNERFRELNNNLEFALAAYNGGEGRMRQLAKRSRGKSFWSPEVMAQLPRETQEYVPYVLAAAWLYLHPEDYGLEFPKVDGAPGQVQLARAMTLNEITMCLGQSGTRDGWFRTLRNLNPRVDPARPMPAGTTVSLPARAAAAFEAQCVDGRMAQLASELQRARGTGAQSIAMGGGRKYVVRPGDTLASIAKRQRCTSPEALARANNIPAPRYLIKPSQQLTLVGCSA